MRIALDNRVENICGIKRYTEQLWYELNNLDDGNEYILIDKRCGVKWMSRGTRRVSESA